MAHSLSITKEEINELPLYRFEGEINLIESKEDALAAISKLNQAEVLGFDTETRPAFKKGERYNISLLQLATDKEAYLFRLNKFQFPQELAEILENENIIKAGVGIRDDIIGLKKLTPFKEANFVDLAEVAKTKQIKNFGLRALTAILLGKRLSKKAKVSNWELNKLSNAQIAYAACDAVVGYKIYHQLR